MKRLLALCVFILLVTIDIRAQSSADSLFLDITIPEQDTTYVPFNRYRYGAGTHPDARAFVNGEEVKVYENGAFAGLVELDGDTAYLNIEVALGSKVIKKTLVFIKPGNETDEPKDRITHRMEMPESDRWLRTGEVLKVRFQGEPGRRAVFNIDGFKRNIPMRELAPEFADGKTGVYVGEYEVKAEDRIENRHITFKMDRGLFGYHKKKSRHTVSFNGLPRVAEVITDNAYLNVGMGMDRLGGTRYGYLEKGVRLIITGRKLDNYRVQLSEVLSAWIPVDQVQLLPVDTPLPISLAGNIRVTGNAYEDLITLNLDEKLPYTTTQTLEPATIIVNVWGATSNTNWKTKHLNSEGIESVDWKQAGDNHYQLIIRLKHKQNWGYSIGYGWRSQMVIKVKRPPVVRDTTQPLLGQTIAVDAGHGGSNDGSLGSTGTMEKQVTLEITEKIDSILTAKGARVVLPRTDDRTVYMSDRVQAVLENRADLLVSIHANSIGYLTDPFAVRGTGTFYKHIAFKPLAEKMYKKMLELGLEQYGLTGSFNFMLNGPTEFPNVLVETAFISNPEEELLLTNPEFQTRIAEQIVKGLEEYYLENAYIATQD